MMKIRGIDYWVEDGKYTVDGYDLFDTLAELEDDLVWQLASIEGKAYKDGAGWHLI